jgi:hypothetical protein
VCRHAMQPIPIATPVLVPDPEIQGHYALEIVYRCARTTCASFFIERYRSSPGHPYSLRGLAPQTPAPAIIEPAITQLSPSFVKIYNQAFTGEVSGLDEIAGVGFRKEYRDKFWRKGKSVDYSHEREWRVPHDLDFELEHVEFVIVASYSDMARAPKQLKDGIGRDKWLIMDNYARIEHLWPVHRLPE